MFLGNGAHHREALFDVVLDHLVLAFVALTRLLVRLLFTLAGECLFLSRGAIDVEKHAYFLIWLHFNKLLVLRRVLHPLC